ncbi:MAG: tetratricopeptide repeat protein, partial [Candidatus Didemnitutus sp.]|nr:tetratricopeptide repeat protein [Candidatus Didemnitutus sp.]
MFAFSSVNRWLADRRGAALLLVLAALAAYGNSFHGPFVFDDVPSITDNPTIRSLSSAWQPPTDAGITVAGRPLLNVSFALNYSLSGDDVWSYHALNLLIHLVAALLLYGLVRHTAESSSHTPAARDAAALTALGAALLWVVHPLTTAAVTASVQRAESLAACWMLATLYTFARGAAAPAARWWTLLAITSCFAGVATKEIAAVTPVLVLLYDRTFVAGTFAQALRQRARLYVALAASWLLLAALMATTGARGGSVGFATALPWWHYTLQQSVALVHYVRLVFWPHPLVFDYGTPVLTSLSAALPTLLVVGCALLGTAVALWRAPRVGFFAATFFLLLAPSSSVLPIATQTMAEHRVYLPLAVIVIACGFGLTRLAGRFALAVCLGLAVVLGSLTWQRNLTYQDEVRLWRDTAAAAPSNPRAHHNLGFALAARHERTEAVTAYRQALTLDPSYADALNNLGNTLLELGQVTEAHDLLHRATVAAPANAEAWNGLGNATPTLDDAIAAYRRAVALAPNYAIAQSNLGLALARRGDNADALAALQTAVNLAPRDVALRNNLANFLAAQGRTGEAAMHYAQALADDSHSALTRFNRGSL